MNPRRPRLSFILTFLVTTLSLTAAPLRVLYFTKSSGFEHGAVKRAGDQPSPTEKVLAVLGPQHDITFTFSKDGSLFSREYLTQFDAVLFFTSGDLTSVGTDGQPAMTAAGKQALLDYVAGGGGFVGVHAASDTFHTRETGGGNPPPEARGNRYQLQGEASDPYIKMLGGEFINHDQQQVARATVVDPTFPGFGNLGAGIEVREEWYTLKEFAPNDHVLLIMETEGMVGENYARPPFPLAWARTHGQGRVAFNAMGHRDDVWSNPAYQAMLVGMLEWAAGRVAADVTPNLARVAPGHATLQPRPAALKP